MKASLSVSHRLPHGGLVDRQSPREFTFDGRRYAGYAGDTLASALLANDVRLVGRSFKYHRPRGILSAGNEEPNALVELRTGARREPNTRATVIELYDGLVAASQNRWPTLAFDIMAANSLLGSVLSAGFYYKTFMWPAAFWEKVYEPLIRRAAGLGRAAGVADPDHYEKATAFCDVLVIGSGPAGLMAALAAGRAGARVILCEDDFRIGGRLLAERQPVQNKAGGAWVADVEAELGALPDVQILRRTAVFGAYDQRAFAAVERVNDHLPVPPEHEPRQRLWRIVAKRAVVAAGAIERPIVFGDNDRPGVMLAGAIRTYLNRFAVAPGRRAVLFINNDAAAQTAHDLQAAGVAVAAIVDSRPAPSPFVENAARAVRAPLHRGAAIERTFGSPRGVQAAAIRTSSGTVHTDCDLIAMSGGWDPALSLTSHLGGRPVWNDAIGAFVPGDLPPALRVAGAAAGTMTLQGALQAGIAAGQWAAADLGLRIADMPLPELAFEPAARALPFRVAKSKGKAFVDFQNDVTDKDLELAVREGYRSPELAKRYTTLGMATDQGKTSAVNGLAIIAELTGRGIADTGTTTFRPPAVPVALGALVGHHRGKDFRPTRRTPGHDWAAEQGATFIEAGPWLRAQYFPKPGDRNWLDAAVREVTAVRTLVGICDVSTLGKIDLQGADAAKFLDRLYVNTFSTLPVGRARYGLMLREDGIVFDDGTVAHMADDRYCMTTTTANAAKVMQHMDFCHQVLWPDLDVQFVSVTDQWAQFSIAGPRAREVLRRLVAPEFDIADAAFPHMAAADAAFRGSIRGRLFRLSFSGELAYELAIPAGYGDAMIRAIMDAGHDFGIAPYGTEALTAMRVEKGHVAGGELNGQTTARDLGLGRMLSQKKDYIGRALAQRPAFTDPKRPTLAGFRPVDRSQRLSAGAHFIAPGAPATIGNDQGHMTSVAYSPTLGHWIGLGLIERGPERIGEFVRAYDPVRNGDVLAEIVDPVFHDKEGRKLRG